MGWMDDLLGKEIQQNTAILPDRKRLNFIGGGISVTDNPANESTDVQVGETSSGLDPLEPQSNSGTSAYPTSAIFAIAPGFTFVRDGVADYDSVRIYGAGGSESTQLAFASGTVVNLSGFVLSLYPLVTQHLFIMGVDYGAGTAFSIAVGSSARWVLDDDLNFHILT